MSALADEARPRTPSLEEIRVHAGALLARDGWSRERLLAHQQEMLRALLRGAREVPVQPSLERCRRWFGKPMRQILPSGGLGQVGRGEGTYRGFIPDPGQERIDFAHPPERGERAHFGVRTTAPLVGGLCALFAPCAKPNCSPHASN